MNQPERFGPFLLFQRTETNIYRSCYRAGITNGRAVERIVRLEVFDQPGFDPGELIGRVESSADLQTRLRDPHIAPGAGVGQVGGTPFAAYDFELGTTLATFLSVARQKSFPVPFDQALFIAERVALALAAAYQLEQDGEPILHSFLTPDSVLLSNEGEVKVCGFEIAPALRGQLSGKLFSAPYLSPQCRAGKSTAAQDDVFSLGSILFELVTGNPLEVESTESIDLSELTIRATGEPAPERLRVLLATSFAPPGSRIPDVMAWQQSLGKLILDGEYNPTTFNLAFLLHTLLRDPLARGVESLEREKRFVLPRLVEPDATGKASAEHSPIGPSGAGTPEGLDGPQDATGDALQAASDIAGSSHDRDADRPGSAPFWLGFSISAFTASALLGSFLFLGKHSEDTSASQPAAPASAAIQVSRVEGVPPPKELADPETVTGPENTPPPTKASSLVLTEVVNGELDQPQDEDEVRRAVAERTEEIERRLKSEYEERLASLREEIIERRRREGAGEQDRVTLPDAAAGPASRTTETPQEVTETANPVSKLPSETAERSANEPPAPAIDQAPEPGAPDLTTSEAAETEPGPAATARESIEAAPPEALGPATTASGPARQGSTDAAGSVEPIETPAQLLHLTPPSYPTIARRLKLSATARVKVLISPQGKVTEAEILGPPLGSGFDQAALAAVRRSRWEPATRNGDPIESSSVLTLEFKP